MPSKQLDFPYYQIEANDLSRWLNEQPETSWWVTDGDPFLMSRLSLPCPKEELIEVLDKRGGTLHLFDPRENSQAEGDPFDQMDEIADTNNNPKARTFLLCWTGDEQQWLLYEDFDAVND